MLLGWKNYKNHCIFLKTASNCLFHNYLKLWIMCWSYVLYFNAFNKILFSFELAYIWNKYKITLLFPEVFLYCFNHGINTKFSGATPQPHSTASIDSKLISSIHFVWRTGFGLCLIILVNWKIVICSTEYTTNNSVVQKTNQ